MADDEDSLSCGEVIQSLVQLSTPDAIDQTCTVDLGGVPQVVNIRGADRGNPVLLFVHGGPGTPLAPTAWMWQRPVEEFFTVVHYDQRAAGLSHRLTDSDTVRTAMGVDQYVRDAVQLAEWVCRELAVDRVILAGHSWGTAVATKAALERPDLFTACGYGRPVGTVIPLRGRVPSAPLGPEPLWRTGLGAQLRAERHRRGERLADVASHAGVSTQYLSELERGKKEASSEVVAALAGALGLSVVDRAGGWLIACRPCVRAPGTRAQSAWPPESHAAGADHGVDDAEVHRGLGGQDQVALGV